MIFNIFFPEPPCITEEMLVSMLIRLGHNFHPAAMEQKKQKKHFGNCCLFSHFFFVSMDY